MSTPFWDSCNQEIVNYAFLLAYCSISIEYVHIGHAVYEDIYLTNVISVFNNISFFIDLRNCKNTNWNETARQWICQWAGQLLILLDGWRHSKLLYFSMCVPEMTVNGKHGIRVAAFLSCFLSSNFKTVRTEQEGKRWSEYLGLGGRHFCLGVLFFKCFVLTRPGTQLFCFSCFFESTESATALVLEALNLWHLIHKTKIRAIWWSLWTRLFPICAWVVLALTPLTIYFLDE